MTGESTSYDFKFQLPSPLSQTDYKLYLRFPNTTISEATSTIVCLDKTKNQAYPSCKIAESANGYVTLVEIDNFCALATCDASTT